MPSRFDEAPEEPMLLTPELAERVVERYAERQAERQRAEAAERERQASLTRIQELADLLGAPPEEIREIADEEVKRGRPVAAKPAVVSSPGTAPRWPIHIGYLAVLAAVLVWATLPKSPPDHQVPFSPPPFVATTDGMRFDPIVGGTVRPPNMKPPWELYHEVLVHPSILPLPAGLRAKLITDQGEKTVGGPPGRVKGDRATAEAFRRSIRSLLAYEESLGVVEGDVPIVNYDQAPWTENDARFQGQPTIVGWHVVEVSNGVGNYRALLPDRRYAKDMAAYERAMKTRLEHLTDTKFFSDVPPANLRANAMEIPFPALPKGASMMAWDAKETVWAQGTAPRLDPEALRQGIDDFMREATRRLGPTMEASDNEHLQITLVFPGGETYDNWPLDAANGYPPGGAQDRQRAELENMVAAAKAGFNPVGPPKTATHYGSAANSRHP